MTEERFQRKNEEEVIIDNDAPQIIYHGYIEDTLLSKLNALDESYKHLKQIKAENENDIMLLRIAVNGLLAVSVLRRKGYIDDEFW